MGLPRLRLRVTELNETKIWGSIIIFERYRAFNKIKWSAKRMQRMEQFFGRASAFLFALVKTRPENQHMNNPRK